MSISYKKIKSVAKDSLAKGEKLDSKILNTMKRISDIVGATLGPGGCPILIERQEYGIPNIITKDGVSVFRSLGFSNPIEHGIMEAARDAATRTASEAGDGTTTATILAEAFVRYTNEFVKKHSTDSPQKIVRQLQNIFKNKIEPLIHSSAIKPYDINDPLYHSVAKCSANGDTELADSVMECFKTTGDAGNITIIEKSGPSGYKVDLIKGYSLSSGYEDSCLRFFPAFINDKANSRVYLEKPLFILNYGTINDIQSLFNVTGYAMDAWKEDPSKPYCIVMVATGFSDTLLGHLASNWSDPTTINVYPLILPKTPMINGQMEILEDIQALTGATIFDPIRRPIEKAVYEDLGSPLEYFESNRYRSNIVGMADEGLLLAHYEQVQQSVNSASSELEKRILQERVANLTGGIARLTVMGSSTGEIREKKDRCDDAICAIRGTLKYGCLPGGGWTLAKIYNELYLSDDPVIKEVLLPAIKTPIIRLMSNIGLNNSEIDARFLSLTGYIETCLDPYVWDGITDKFIAAKDSGIMDSVPAVLEAIRSSLSIATLLGTLGGVIVFERDNQLERQEAIETNDYLRDTNSLGT